MKKFLGATLALFFLISAAWSADGPPFWVLKSRNLRDLGGWSRPGWGPFKRGILFRSRALDNLSQEEIRAIKALRLKTIVDLRSLDEITTNPDSPEILRGVHYIVASMRSLNDISTEEECLAVCGPNHENCRWTGDKCEGPFDCSYVYYVLVNRAFFQAVLRAVAEGSYLPALFHCEYGVDRGGTLSAFLLYLAGVPREEILADYQSSEKIYEELGLEFSLRPFLLEKLLDWFEGQDQTCTSLRFKDLFENNQQGLIIKFRQSVTPENVLIPEGAFWKYNDFGPQKNMDPAYSSETGISDGRWKEVSFNDHYWKEGQAPLGFSLGREKEAINTTVEPDYETQEETKARIPVYYFRRSFVVNNKQALGGLKLRLWVDDGAIVYLNGQEILRENVPEDLDPLDPSVYSGQEALFDPDQYPDEPFRSFYREYLLPTSFLREGKNVLAVQVYQATMMSSDLVFDLELLAVPPEEGVPSYRLIRMEAPQILAAGFDPTRLPEEPTATKIWALVRPGANPVAEVKAFWNGYFLGDLTKEGRLRNGDEIWSLKVVAPSWAEGLLFGPQTLQLKAFGTDGLSSAVFPKIRFTAENALETSPAPAQPAEDPAGKSTVAPQLLACGINPSLIPLDMDTIEVLAVVRPGKAPLSEVLLYRQGLPVEMQEVGRFPNGDRIFATEVEIFGLPGQEIDLLGLGWNILAYDEEGGVSNPCFNLIRY